jgi:hypothetical protein
VAYSQAVFRVSLIAMLAALAVAGPSAAGGARPGPRILDLGDWLGHWTLYAADPAGSSPSGQITFSDDVTAPSPAPDGRRIAYVTTDAPCRLVVAKPDGSDRRTIARTATGCGGADVAWSPDSKRLLYRLGRDSIHIVRVDGKGRRVSGIGVAPAWSPNGRSFAFLDDSELFVSTKGTIVGLHAPADEFAWSPTAKWIAVADSGFGGPSHGVVLVRPGGVGSRKISNRFATGLAWSHDGRFLAFHTSDGIEVVDVAKSSSRLLASPNGLRQAWSPKRDLLSFDGSDGLELLDATNGTTRYLSSDHTLAPTWSPDGRSIAYVVHLDLPDYREGDLRVADLSGGVRTVVQGSGAAGGQMDVFAWIRPRGTVHYRLPRPRSMPTVSARELDSPWKIERIATDGERLAYVSCGHIFVWTPATGDLRQAEPAASLFPFCRQPNDPTASEPFEIYDLTLAGDRLAFATRTGNMSQAFTLYEEGLSPAPMPRVVMSAGAFAGCGVGSGGLGELAGAGDLIVFSRWREVDLRPGCAVRTTSQEIDRLDPGGCPCPVLESSPGPLVPTDVDEGRTVAVGDNQVLILNRGGAVVLSIPLSAASAQLAGSDLVVARRGELLHYDARTGVLLQTWVLPDVPTAGSCGSPHPWTCTAPLVLRDTRRGFATYTVGGEVHVIRLADGQDASLGPGTTAQFFDGGLVYADGSRIHIVPFEALSPR